MHHRMTFTTGIGRNAHGLVIDEFTAERKAALVREGLAEGFGGFTELRGFGGWKDAAGKLVKEPNRTWIVMTDNPGLAKDTAGWIAGLFDQTCVMLAVEELAIPVMFIAPKVAALEVAA